MAKITISLLLLRTKLYFPRNRIRRNGPSRTTLMLLRLNRVSVLQNATEPMIKAAIVPLGALLFFATTPVSLAQAPDQEMAVNEAVYRQANIITLRNRLAEARGAQDRGQLPIAAKLYDDAWELVQKIGSGIDAETQATKTGLAEVRLALAHQAQNRGDYREAKTQVTDVLRVDPGNVAAQEFNKNNEKLLKEKRTLMPSEDVQNRVPVIIEEKAKNSVLVQDGKVLYEMGKLD